LKVVSSSPATKVNTASLAFGFHLPFCFEGKGNSVFF